MWSQSPFPPEIVDAVVDCLHADTQALGACALVCADWLPCSRHHLFSTARLSSRRAARFSDLARSSLCTFASHVHRLELDGSESAQLDPLSTPAHSLSGTSHGHDGCRAAMASHEDDATSAARFMQCLIIASDVPGSRFPCLTSLKLANGDWTALSPCDQIKALRHLAKLSRSASRAPTSKIEDLSLENIAFHDLRDVMRVLGAFPNLRRVEAHVRFAKYLEYNVAGAAGLQLPLGVTSLELGVHEEAAVFLSSLAGSAVTPRIDTLVLQKVGMAEVGYLNVALRKFGGSLLRLSLHLSCQPSNAISAGELLNAINLTHQPELTSLRVDGIMLPPADTDTASATLASVLNLMLDKASALPSLEHLGLGIHRQTGPSESQSVEVLDWPMIERAIKQTRSLHPKKIELRVLESARREMPDGSNAKHLRL